MGSDVGDFLSITWPISLGSTRYCIDKNYAGVLIIWDRIFGTFEAERKEEPVVYGLIGQLESFNPFYLEVSPNLTSLNSNLTHTIW